jgi:diguanylate cyclase (GGDEF)-like protein
VLLRAVNKFVQGAALDGLHLECERGLKILEQSHQPRTAAMLHYGVLLPLQALRGQTIAPGSFDTATDSASAYFAGDYTTPSIPLALYHAAKVRHAYLLGDAEQWRASAAQRAMVSACLPDSPSWVEASFYLALGLLRTEFNEPSGAASQRAQAESLLMDFQTWAHDGPWNFRHKALLVEAELERVRGHEDAAMDLYAKAIDAAAEAGFPGCEALANELYARFWLERGQKQLSSNFVRDAYYHYRRWGAEVKCRQLEADWPGVSFKVLERPRTDVGQSRSHRSVSEHTDALDLHSLLKTTQFLAKEIQLESLLPKMLDVLLENAGAEHGAILLDDEGRLIVEVAGGLSDGRRFDCQLVSRPLEDLASGDRPALPTALIEYVQLTRTTLLLNDPPPQPRFGNNPNLQQRQPKSVLCLPVHTQGKLVALVYLENNLMEHAFTSKHQQTLELLSSQAAISLVNARLYESLERKVLARTEELRLMSMKDGLTGIANRRSFDERLAVELRRGLRNQAPLSLLMVDIDHFKQYNDLHGHFQGDDCIRAVAANLAALVSRAGDLVARYGGEEFAILLPETDAEAAVQVAQACMDAVDGLALPHGSSPAGTHVGLSIGVCTLVVTPDTSPATLITRADQALYQAKRDGRHRWVRYVPAHEDTAKA